MYTIESQGRVGPRSVAKRRNAHSIRGRLHRALISLDTSFPLVPRYDLESYVHWKGNNTSPIHRWLRYREAYSPELIKKLGLGKKILDPFCGCGSIMLGAALQGRQSYGIDLNPLAVFAANVKLRRLTGTQLNAVQRFSQSLSRLEISATPWPVPSLSIAHKVFEPRILDTLMRVRTALEQHAEGDSELRDFLLLAWVAVLEKVGSYFKEGNGIKYRNKKRQLGRYGNRPDGEWQLKRFGQNQRDFVLKALNEQLSSMLQDAALWGSGSWASQKVSQGSAFELERHCARRRFDSIVFSPPYANRFDYFESFKVELWFGGFVKTYEDLNALRKMSMRSHLGADYSRPFELLEPLEELIDMMDKHASSWRMGVADLLRGYFHDLRIVLEQCREVMPRGKCSIVVGNSAFAGVIIPTDVLTAIVGINAGFKKAQILETRHLTVAPQQRNILRGFEGHMRESVVVLD